MLVVMVRLIRYCPQTCLTCIDDMKDTRLREFYVKDCNIHIVFLTVTRIYSQSVYTRERNIHNLYIQGKVNIHNLYTQGKDTEPNSTGILLLFLHNLQFGIWGLRKSIYKGIVSGS